MRATVVWVVVVGCLVAGCGDEAVEAEPGSAAVTATPTSGPAPGAGTRPTSRPQLFARAVRLLGTVGVRGVAETEPSHGSPAEALSGRWRGHEVLAGVVPTRRATPAAGVLRSYRVQGLEVRVLDSPPYVVHQVELGRDTWSVVVPDDEAASEELVRAMVTAAHPADDVEDPAAMVAHADNLYGARVVRTGDRLDVTALWGISCDHDGCAPAVLVTREGDAEPTYEVGSYDRLQQALRVDGTYGAGSVALRDRRLWVRDGGGWTRYAPDRPTFEPPLADPPPSTPPLRALGATAEDPVVWLETWDQRVYVSTDDARTFREVDVR